MQYTDIDNIQSAQEYIILKLDDKLQKTRERFILFSLLVLMIMSYFIAFWIVPTIFTYLDGLASTSEMAASLHLLQFP